MLPGAAVTLASSPVAPPSSLPAQPTTSDTVKSPNTDENLIIATPPVVREEPQHPPFQCSRRAPPMSEGASIPAVPTGSSPTVTRGDVGDRGALGYLASMASG